VSDSFLEQEVKSQHEHGYNNKYNLIIFII